MHVLSSRILIRPVYLERSLGFYGETLGLAVCREFGEGIAVVEVPPEHPLRRRPALEG